MPHTFVAAIRVASGLLSHPMQDREDRRDSWRTVPLPQKGSSTTSPGRESVSMRARAKAESTFPKYGWTACAPRGRRVALTVLSASSAFVAEDVDGFTLDRAPCRRSIESHAASVREAVVKLLRYHESESLSDR